MNHLDHCEQLTDRFCRSTLEHCWQRLDQRLDQLAQQISDEHRRTRHYLAMQEVHFKSDQVAASLAKQNQQNFIRFRGLLPLRVEAPGNTPAEHSAGEQRDSLTLNRVIQNIAREQHPAITQLNQRLSLLRGGQRCPERENPMAPGAICLSFQNAVGELDIDPRTRLLMHEVFAEQFEQSAAEFYHSANTYLVEAGVLPNLLSTAGQARKPEAATPDDRCPQPNADQERQLDQALALLAKDIEWPAAIRNALDLPGILPTETYISACTLLQRQIAAHVDFQQNQLLDPSASKRQYFKYLIAHMSRHRAGINRDLLLSVELLTRLFQYLCDDQELPAELRCLSSFLYAPCIKLAVTDRSFFLSSQHPARQLLDALLNHGSRWLSSQVEDPAMLETIRGLVSTLACDLSDTGMDFSRALQEMKSYTELLDQSARQTEQREVQSQAGMESLDRARSTAQALVRDTLQQHHVLQGTCEYLSGPCTDYLTFILLQHGEGRHWTQAQHLLKGIALSVRGQLPREQLIQFQRGQQRLYKAVSKGLIETGYQGMLAQDLLSCLRHAQQQLVEKLAFPEAEFSTGENVPDNEATGEQLEQLQTGLWYRFEDRPQTSPIQLKLAWHSEACGRALFVDASGERRRLEYADTLRKALNNGHLYPARLPSGQHSEDVLGTILHQLRLNSLRQRFDQRPGPAGKSRQKIC